MAIPVLVPPVLEHADDLRARIEAELAWCNERAGTEMRQQCAGWSAELEGLPRDDEPALTVLLDEVERALIKRVLPRLARPAFDRCYREALRQSPLPTGQITLGWHARDGAVHSSYIVSNTTGDPELGGCVLHALQHVPMPSSLERDIQKSWRFEPGASRSQPD